MNGLNTRRPKHRLLTASLVAITLFGTGCAAGVKEFKALNEPFQDPPPKEIKKITKDEGAIKTRLIQPGKRGLRGIKNFLWGNESGEDRLSASFRKDRGGEKLLDEVRREYQEPAGVDYELLKLARETGRLYTIYFTAGSVAVKDVHREMITKNGAWLRAFPETRIRIEGHTDDKGTLEYNLAVGQARADTVEHFLVDLGVAKERITTITLGEERPAYLRDTERARARNSRVEFIIRYP